MDIYPYFFIVECWQKTMNNSVCISEFYSFQNEARRLNCFVVGLVKIKQATPNRNHGDDNTELARLRHLRCVRRRLARYRFLSFGDRRPTTDHPGVHHGRPQTWHPANGDVAVRFIQVGYSHTRFPSRDVHVWNNVSPMGVCSLHDCSNLGRTHPCTVDLPSETGQH